MLTARLHRFHFLKKPREGLLLFVGACGLLSPLRAHPETANALADLTALIAKHPNNAALYLRRADCWEEHADWPSVEADLRQAAALAPTFLGARLGLARLYGKTGRWTEARIELDSILVAKPTQTEALILRARTLAQLGSIEAAYADYTAAIAALAEPKPEIFLERAALPIDAETALAGVDEGIERLGPALTLVTRAIELDLRLDRIDAAIARIDQLVTLSERSETWWRRRGAILEKAGRWAEARFSYEKALAAIDRLPPWLRRSSEVVSLSTELHHLISECPPPS